MGNDVEMTNDLERGRSKDLTVYDQATGATPTTTLTDSRPKQATSHKYLLLGVFCLGVFIDGQSPTGELWAKVDSLVLGVCVFYLLIAPVAQDLDIVFEQQTWVIVSVL